MGQTYVISRIFRSLISEGAFAGTKAAFLHFQGCNLWDGDVTHRETGRGACSGWCDSGFTDGAALGIPEILAALDTAYPHTGVKPWVVLAGGEPMLQVDSELVFALGQANWLVAMETNGTLPIPDAVRFNLNWLVVSPKLGTNGGVTKADELRVAIPGALPPDPGWTDDALEKLESAGDWGAMYVTPVDPVDPTTISSTFLRNRGKDRAMAGAYQLNLQRCVSFVDRHPDWQLALPTSKLAGIP